MKTPADAPSLFQAPEILERHGANRNAYPAVGPEKARGALLQAREMGSCCGCRSLASLVGGEEGVDVVCQASGWSMGLRVWLSSVQSSWVLRTDPGREQVVGNRPLGQGAEGHGVMADPARAQ